MKKFTRCKKRQSKEGTIMRRVSIVVAILTMIFLVTNLHLQLKAGDREVRPEFLQLAGIAGEWVRRIDPRQTGIRRQIRRSPA